MKKSWGLAVILTSALFFISCSSKSSKINYNYVDYDEEIYLQQEYKKTGIKIPNRWEIRKYLNYYTHKDKKFIKEGLYNAQKFLPTIKRIFKKYGIPEDLSYLPLIESKFNPYAVSSSGAAGLWQFLPVTARRFGLKINYKIDERKDPYKSTIAAAKYFRYLYSIFHRWDLVLAAYNCGEGCIKRKLRGRQNFWHIKHRLPRQTKEYVPRFYAALLIAKNPQKYGIYVPQRPLFIIRKKAKTTFSLKKFAQIYDIDYNLLNLFNAHLKRKIAYKGVFLNIPLQPNKVKKVSLQYMYYKVKKGDTLYSISKKFGINLEDIIKVNNLKGYNIKINQILKIPINY